MIETLSITRWHETFSQEIQTQAVTALERGKVLFLPELAFEMSEKEIEFLTPAVANPKSKNISFDIRTDSLQGAICSKNEFIRLKEMIRRYAIQTNQLMSQLLHQYQNNRQQARTSFRPIEIQNRATSPRKDDTRLHVDAFPSSPTQGKRILRMFTNVNHQGKNRVWRLGTSFERVVENFLPQVRHPIFGVAHLLRALKMTRGQRTAYDHYMLQIHNAMKYDLDYQKNVPQIEFHFPPGSSWIIYTDQVSHAAMSGQHTFEQTFHLPIEAMADEHCSPLRILEKKLGKTLR